MGSFSRQTPLYGFTSSGEIPTCRRRLPLSAVQVLFTSQTCSTFHFLLTEYVLDA